MTVTAPESRTLRPDAAAPAAVVFGGGERVREQLRRLGVHDIRSAVEAGEGPLLLIDGTVEIGDWLLASFLSGGSAALVGPHDGPPVRVAHMRIASAGSSRHSVGRATTHFLGVLRVAAEHRAALPAGAALDVALVALVRSGAYVLPRPLRGFSYNEHRTDEEAARLEASVKAVDGFFTTFFVSPYSRYIARWCARRGLTPNQVTCVSMALGVIAAAGFATGDRAGMIAGALLLQAAFTLDCVDGQLARYSRRFSAFGAWLDSILDRGKEYVVYAGLAVGGHAWTLAAATLALQTARHMVDFSYPAIEDRVLSVRQRRPHDDAGDGVTGPPVPAGAGTSPLTWAKRAVQFPIGERFAAISLTAALFDARATFIVALAWGALATAYVVLGRLRRSVRFGPDADGPVPPELVLYRDDGPLARRLLPPPGGANGWLWPPVVRALEYGGIAAAGAIAGGAWRTGAFCVLAALAAHHYDLVYRPRTLGSGRARPWLGGWDGRLLLVYVLLMAIKEAG